MQAPKVSNAIALAGWWSGIAISQAPLYTYAIPTVRRVPGR